VAGTEWRATYCVMKSKVELMDRLFVLEKREVTLCRIMYNKVYEFDKWSRANRLLIYTVKKIRIIMKILHWK
jgi:hypothetical protein